MSAFPRVDSSVAFERRDDRADCVRDSQPSWTATLKTVTSVALSAAALTGLEKSFLCQSQNFLGCHFSGRIFFHLGRNRAPRLESLGAKKEKEAIFEAIFCTHPDTNIINEMIASSFFGNENRKAKKKKERKKRKRNYQKEPISLLFQLRQR